MKSYFSYMQEFLMYITKQRYVLIDLVKRDFKSKYLGSSLGIIWAFIQPTIMIFIFWFVFQVGFKSQPVYDVPFIIWLMAGIIPWFFISDALLNATNSIISNSYLVKKVVFRVSVLPIIKLISSGIIHVFFILIMIIMVIMYDIPLSVYNLQIFYYLFATIVFLLGVTLVTSTIIIFFKDIEQIISMILQFGFWLTPIFWTLEVVPEKYQFFIKLNPVYYLIEGYRDTFINQKWFWEHKLLTPYFWVITCLALFLGLVLYKKLRPHFSDVL